MKKQQRRLQQRSIKQKKFFFEMMNIISQTHREKKREKTQINKIRNGKGEVTTNNTEI